MSFSDSQSEKFKPVVVGEAQVVELDDLAAKYASDSSQPLDEATNKKLRLKADLYVLPILFLVYMVQYMDKISNGVGALLSLREDLNMHGKMYSWVGSSYYLGFLVFEFPVAYLLHSLALSKSTSIIICVWGVIMMASAACKTYSTYIATRVLLGALEGAITPSFMVLTAQWYRREEQFSRTCFWYASVHIGGFLANCMGIGFIKQDHPSLSGWQLINLAMGAITVFLGIVYWFAVPNNPSEAWFLTSKEKSQQVERIRDNKQGYGTHHVKWYQIREALLDIRTYLLFFSTAFFGVFNGAYTNFQTLLIKGLGYSNLRSLVMAFPTNFTGWAGVTLYGILAIYFFKRYQMVWPISAFALNIMDLCLLAWGPNNATKMAGLSLFCMFSPTGYIGILFSVESNVAGHTKKIFTSGVVLVAYCVGNIIGPQMFSEAQAPHYPSARQGMAGCSVAAFLLLLALEVVNIIENKKRDRIGGKLDIVNSEFADLTDKQNPEFRYQL